VARVKPLQTREDTKRREDEQRRFVRARDAKFGCRFERRLMSGKWVPCGKKDAQDTAHILRRQQCGKVWDSPRVALLGCRTCHRNYDGNVTAGDTMYEVRVPYDLAADAFDFVRENTKTSPYARYNPDENGLYKDVVIGRGVAL
jgi:hypothetical protein